MADREKNIEGAIAIDKTPDNEDDGLFAESEEMEQELEAGAAQYTGPLPSAEMLDEDAAARARAKTRATTRAKASSSAMGVGTQAFRFIISGGISAIFDLGLTAILQLGFGLSAGMSRSFGFVLGTIVAYLINRRWTFQAEPSKRRFAAVALLYVITYFVNVGLHMVGYNLLSGWGLSEVFAVVIAYVVAQGTATVVNFLVQRKFIFNVT